MNGELNGCFLPATALDMLMPMHVVVGPKGKLRHVGPTLARIAPTGALDGLDFFDVFTVERPRRKAGARRLDDLIGRRARLHFTQDPSSTLKATVLPLTESEGHLVDLSFGISVVSAVAEHGLTGADFPSNDPTVEMLYLAEANAAVMEEARRLIGRLQSARDTAESASLTDGLTGLRNRRAFENEVELRLRRNLPFCLMHIDLDYFKAVNDTHGHAAGDAVLFETARRLNEEIRVGDFVARIGGDEFVLLVSRNLNARELLGIAERIISSIEVPTHYKDEPCRISASVGIVLSTAYEIPSLATMMLDADQALYDAKESGRGRAVMVTNHTHAKQSA